MAQKSVKTEDLTTTTEAETPNRAKPPRTMPIM
nr:MAG TPA: hypothetical protein [Caudoviricetes sp.]